MTLIAVWMVVRESRILSQKSDNEVKWQIVLSFAFQTKPCSLVYSHPFALELTKPITPPLEFLEACALEAPGQAGKPEEHTHTEKCSFIIVLSSLGFPFGYL